MIELEVPLGDRSYPGARRAPARGTGSSRCCRSGVKRAAIVTQRSIGVDVDPGVEHRIFTMGEGEDAKDLGTVEDLCRDFGRWGLTRGDVVVAVGGGVVTDTAGSSPPSATGASRSCNVATTLLGQVDAAIGGKTGVNLPEGKNLVGAFWQPSAVLCDTEVLATLPPREYRSGLGEMAKYAFLGVDRPAGPARSTRRSRRACDARPRSSRPTSARAAGGRSSTTATRWPTRWRRPAATTCATARRSRSAWSTPPSWRTRLGRIDADRVAEHRHVVAGYDLPMTSARRHRRRRTARPVRPGQEGGRRRDVRARRPSRRRAGPDRRPGCWPTRWSVRP